MPNKTLYKKRILNEINSMPEEALPKIVRLPALIREEFMEQDTDSETIESDIKI